MELHDAPGEVGGCACGEERACRWVLRLTFALSHAGWPSVQAVFVLPLWQQACRLCENLLLGGCWRPHIRGVLIVGHSPVLRMTPLLSDSSLQ